MTRLVLARKVAEIRRRLARVRALLPEDLDTFIARETETEALILNLYLALQASVDLAMHVVADRGLGVPGGAREAMSLLAQGAVIPRELATALAAAIGLRNRIAHQYGTLDLALVFEAARDDLGDLGRFADAVAASEAAPAP